MDHALANKLHTELELAGLAAGTDEYYACRFLPLEQRYFSWCAFALKLTIESIPMEVSDPGVGRIKIAWWRNQLQLAAKTDHPLLKLTASLSGDFAILADALDALCMSLENENLRGQFESREQRSIWFGQSYGKIYCLLSAAAEAADKSNFAIIRVAESVEAARSLLRFRIELKSGIIRLASESLARHKLSLDEMSLDSNSTAMRELLSDELAVAAQHLKASIDDLPSDCGPLRAFARLTLARLMETISDGGDLISTRVEITPLRKLWTAWRAIHFCR